MLAQWRILFFLSLTMKQTSFADAQFASKTPVVGPGPLRTRSSRFPRFALSQLKVLSHSEIPESRTIWVTSLVSAGMQRPDFLFPRFPF